MCAAKRKGLLIIVKLVLGPHTMILLPSVLTWRLFTEPKFIVRLLIEVNGMVFVLKILTIPELE